MAEQKKSDKTTPVVLLDPAFRRRRIKTAAGSAQVEDGRVTVDDPRLVAALEKAGLVREEA